MQNYDLAWFKSARAIWISEVYTGGGSSAQYLNLRALKRILPDGEGWNSSGNHDSE